MVPLKKADRSYFAEIHFVSLPTTDATYDKVSFFFGEELPNCFYNPQSFLQTSGRISDPTLFVGIEDAVFESIQRSEPLFALHLAFDLFGNWQTKILFTFLMDNTVFSNINAIIV